MHEPKITISTDIFDVNHPKNNQNTQRLLHNYELKAANLLEKYTSEITLNNASGCNTKPCFKVLRGYRAVLGLLGNEDILDYHLKFLPWDDLDTACLLVGHDYEPHIFSGKCGDTHDFFRVSVGDYLKHKSDIIKKIVQIYSEPQKKISPRKMIIIANYLEEHSEDFDWIEKNSKENYALYLLVQFVKLTTVVLLKS